MSIWMTLRTFSALFLSIFGLGLVFVGSDSRVMVGAFLASIGLTFMLRMALVLRQR